MLSLDDLDLVKCHFCGCAVPLIVAMTSGWLPYFWTRKGQMEGPVCPPCTGAWLEMAVDHEWQAKQAN